MQAQKPALRPHSPQHTKVTGGLWRIFSNICLDFSAVFRNYILCTLLPFSGGGTSLCIKDLQGWDAHHLSIQSQISIMHCIVNIFISLLPPLLSSLLLPPPPPQSLLLVLLQISCWMKLYLSNNSWRFQTGEPLCFPDRWTDSLWTRVFSRALQRGHMCCRAKTTSRGIPYTWGHLF